ncbi:uncharacterized protein JCM15063_001838 [Sporobolomyces koalae]|uniref:uncharacterized protein n=1 Tax=Sporobolomyces koalae TaxID=500713 RepID=UPI003174C4BD
MSNIRQIPPLEQLIYGLDVEIYSENEANDEQSESDEITSFFHLAVTRHVLLCANLHAASELFSRPIRDFERGLGSLRDDFPHLAGRLISTEDVNWDRISPKQRRFAISVIELIRTILEKVKGTGQVPQELLYLWVPPPYLILRELDTQKPNVHHSSSGLHPHSQHSLAGSHRSLSMRKQQIYFG